MATLLLTSVGSLIGGPLGGAVGALIGNQVDRRVLAPKGRQGPRLGDLAIQTSAYGAQLPKLFGRMRAAGTVIWATDLKETRSSEGGGKGQPGATRYAYSASFAVALSARPIRGVARIWADGKLLRGAGGDWKSRTGFRLHPGAEDQGVDPLIASIEGIDGAPAFRGIAYAVFEDMALGDFGNRIPSLSFEVEADAGPVSVGAIAAVLSDGEVTGGDAAALGGYAAAGDSLRGAIEALAALAPLSIADHGAGLAIDADAVPVMIGGDMGASIAGRGVQRARERQAAGTIPDEISITYYEPARDWQAGLQRARRGNRVATRIERIELPAALDPALAKAAAERRLADAWAARATATVTLPWRLATLRPGAIVQLAGERGLWRIARCTLDRMVLSVELVAIPTVPGAIGGASPGRPVPAPDLVTGRTVIALLDLPSLDGGLASTPRLAIAAAGTEAGWRSAPLAASTDGGARFFAIGGTAPPATIGRATSMLPPGDSALFDRAGHVDIELLNDAMWLQSCDDDALVNGANLAMIGEELVQFGAVTPIGVRRFRLYTLLRGRRGTEAAIGGHGANERFVMIAADALAEFAAGDIAIGSPVTVTAAGIGDGPEGVSATANVTGRAVTPLAPVHLRATWMRDTVRLAWTRRSRTGWAWSDGVDAPLGEEDERYVVRIEHAGIVSSVECDRPLFDITPPIRAALGINAEESVTASVVQYGAHAPSPASATLDVPYEGVAP